MNGPTTLDEALRLLEVPPGHDHLETLFGPPPGLRGYRALARLVHPDRVPAARAAEATAAFVRLGQLWERYRRPTARAADVVLRTRRHIYTIRSSHRPGPAEAGRVSPAADVPTAGDSTRGERLPDGVVVGDIAVLHPARCRGVAGDPRPDVMIKIPCSVMDNDLMEREAAALRRMAVTGDPRSAAYLPRLVESFLYAATGGEDGSAGPGGADSAAGRGARRRVNVTERLTGFHSLTRVHAVHPRGLDARDVAWMWRRLLVALGHAHRAGVLHGAVVPDHVLIHPEKHGLVLTDWCYSVPRVPVGGPGAAALVPAVVPAFEQLYPPEVPARRRPDEATDIYLATKCMTYLLGPDAPAPLLRFARGCTLPAAARRPHDAWRLLAELDELLERLYGPRRYRPFSMPAPRSSASHSDDTDRTSQGRS